MLFSTCHKEPAETTPQVESKKNISNLLSDLMQLNNDSNNSQENIDKYKMYVLQFLAAPFPSGTNTIDDLVEVGFLTAGEYVRLQNLKNDLEVINILNCE